MMIRKRFGPGEVGWDGSVRVEELAGGEGMDGDEGGRLVESRY